MIMKKLQKWKHKKDNELLHSILTVSQDSQRRYQWCRM